MVALPAKIVATTTTSINNNTAMRTSSSLTTDKFVLHGLVPQVGGDFTLGLMGWSKMSKLRPPDAKQTCALVEKRSKGEQEEDFLICEHY